MEDGAIFPCFLPSACASYPLVNGVLLLLLHDRTLPLTFLLSSDLLYLLEILLLPNCLPMPLPVSFL
ncbi:hypothetical protein EUGRSUZ_C01357 [Eucalyptus grandis]|uniref:Uncharacterized protein n=2 Tax=Eucalyptus grandis TaxID=71139 RepID=A0A059CP79_EUCGR|nr:hypothetical protein EUGRSUZ_C01357 [Eucalyptus grandis]